MHHGLLERMSDVYVTTKKHGPGCDNQGHLLQKRASLCPFQSTPVQGDLIRI